MIKINILIPSQDNGMNRIEDCKNCRKQFYTDSPYVDKYCGNCRSAYYEINKGKKI